MRNAGIQIRLGGIRPACYRRQPFFICNYLHFVLSLRLVKLTIPNGMVCCHRAGWSKHLARPFAMQ
jgi:hypothetical protein